MTTKPRANSGDKADPEASLQIPTKPDQPEGHALAEVGLSPVANGMATARLFAKGTFGDLSVTGLYETLADRVAAAKNGDLSGQRAMLASQAFALNSIFTEMARRSALNMGEYLDASERYLRLALKAQANSRATIEALERLTGGREQTVRHVHVDNRGGQAVIADTVQTGGKEIAQINEQPHALESMGDAPGQSLRSANAEREAVPVARDA